LRSWERHQLLEEFNNTSVSYPGDKTLVDLFEEQVSENLDSTALVLGEERMTYRELDKRSNQIGHYLRRRGVREDSLVCICLERSIDMIVGILGILKSGGAYVPLDPEYPMK